MIGRQGLSWHDENIDFAAIQGPVQMILLQDEIDRDTRCSNLQLLQEIRKKNHTHIVGCHNSNLALRRLRIESWRVIDQGFCLKNNAMHWIDQRLTKGCKHHISANRDKQRIVEKIPEPTQRRAHAGLTEPQ